MTWAEYVGMVGALAGVPPDHVQADALIVGDLGLDSVGVAELVVGLLQDANQVDFDHLLTSRRWEAETVLSLFEAARAAPVWRPADPPSSGRTAFVTVRPET
jgi:hypothetical protein